MQLKSNNRNHSRHSSADHGQRTKKRLREAERFGAFLQIVLVALLVPMLAGRLLAAGGAVPAGPAEHEFFTFDDFRPAVLPAENGFAGKIGGDFFLIGGRDSFQVYQLAATDDAWRPVMDFEAPLVAGLAISADNGIYCLGAGDSGQQPGRRVLFFQFQDGQGQFRELPEMPFPMVAASAVMMDGSIYVAGCHEKYNYFLRLDCQRPGAGWETLPAWEGAPCLKPALAGLRRKLYLIAGTDQNGRAPTDAFAYTPANGWKSIAPLPAPLTAATAFPCGDAHILVKSNREEQLDIIAHHVVTGTWANLGQWPLSFRPVAVFAEKVDFSFITETGILAGRAVYPPTKYGWLDHAVVIVFFIVMLLVGKLVAKRERSENDYFRAGQRVPWWAAGLSLFATGASAISLMAMPGKAYAENWIYATGSVFALLTLPVTLFFIIPLARRLKVSTAFEYLERRYCPSMRLFGSFVYALNQMLGRMASIMLLPAIALSAICGMPMELSILLMGIITTVYSTMGGLEAVIWTDVIQAVVMLAAMLLCVLWVALSLDYEPATMLSLLDEGNKLHMVNLSFDIAQPIVYLIVISYLFAPFVALSDQNFIQRVQCTPNERTARKAVITSVFVAVPLNFFLFSLGTALFLYYHQHSDQLTPAMKADGVFPLFAAQVLPSGLAGLVVAAIMAATMSTLSSALNSVANIGVEDFVRRFKPTVGDRACLVLGKLFTLILGVFGTVAALWLAKTSLTSIWDLALLLGGMIASPLVAVYILGIFTRRANTAGVVAGVAAAVAMTTYVRGSFHLHPFFFGLLSMLTCLSVGYIVSLLTPLPKRNLDGLTVYTLPKSDEEGGAEPMAGS